MQWVFIEPLDVWMFRDSKPFSAGQSFFARSLFPPQPGTMQGVIRSYYLERRNVNLRAYGRGEIKDLPVGTPSSMGRLRITGPFVARRANGKLTRYLPLPLDVVLLENRIKTGKPYNPKPYYLSPAQKKIKTNLPFDDWLPLTPHSEIELEKTVGGEYWLDETAFEAYLAGELTSDHPTKAKDLYQREERTGLGMDHGRRAHAQSMFYRAEFVRPREGVGLLVGLTVEVFNQPTGTLGIGGEGRSGRYEVLKNYALPDSTVKTGRVKIVLLTPAWFSGGWRPASGDWSRWVGKEAKLVSLALGKPLALSGWDLAKGGPKPLRHFVPAGSVFFFENAQLTGQAFTESPEGDPDYYGAMGYGAYAAGSWDYASPNGKGNK